MHWLQVAPQRTATPSGTTLGTRDAALKLIAVGGSIAIMHCLYLVRIAPLRLVRAEWDISLDDEYTDAVIYIAGSTDDLQRTYARLCADGNDALCDATIMLVRSAFVPDDELPDAELALDIFLADNEVPILDDADGNVIVLKQALVAGLCDLYDAVKQEHSLPENNISLVMEQMQAQYEERLEMMRIMIDDMQSKYDFKIQMLKLRQRNHFTVKKKK